MDVNIREQVLEFIVNDIGIVKARKIMQDNDDLNLLGLNSLASIRLIVLIESYYNFEFNEEDMEADRLSSLRELCDFIEKKKV